MLVPVGLIAGWLARGAADHLGAPPPLGHEVREKQGGLIDPLLDCEAADRFDPHELSDLHDHVESAVDSAKSRGLAEHVSVYFRDLDNGTWFGVEDQVSYSPASLLKVVTLIALLKEAEARPGVLDRKVIFGGDRGGPWTQNVEPPPPLVAGQAYSLDELAERLIVYSDNTASEMIKTALDPKSLERVFDDLQIPYPEVSASEDFLSARQYATFLRILYNASYLGRPMSEHALELLSRSKFEKGLRAGIPSSVTIAHKFGERGYGSGDPRAVKLHQLHECGIVYEPHRPFLLCVMTRGERFEDLATAIREVAKTVHDEVVRGFSPT